MQLGNLTDRIYYFKAIHAELGKKLLLTNFFESKSKFGQIDFRNVLLLSVILKEKHERSA